MDASPRRERGRQRVVRLPVGPCGKERMELTTATKADPPLPKTWVEGDSTPAETRQPRQVDSGDEAWVIEHLRLNSIPNTG